MLFFTYIYDRLISSEQFRDYKIIKKIYMKIALKVSNNIKLNQKRRKNWN